MTDPGIGDRVAQARILAGLKQPEFAAKAAVSLSLLRKVEQGSRPATPAFTAAVAEALSISVTDLTGQPYPVRTGADAAERASIPELRRAIMDAEDLEPGEFDPEDAVRTIRREMRRAKYAEATQVMPDAIRHLHQVAEGVGPNAEHAAGNLAYVYSRAMLAAHHFGLLDLAGLASDRCAQAAAKSGNPLWPVVARNNRALVLLYSGAYRPGMRMIDSAHAELDQIPESPDALAVRGALHLRGAILSARLADATTAATHIDGARDCVDRIDGTQYQHFGTEFTRSNVDIHGVAVPVELADGTAAVLEASRIDPFNSSVPPSRLGHHWIDLARAWVMHGDNAKALAALESARRVAPQLTRHLPMVHETVRHVAHSRRGTDQLAKFARWAGVRI